MSDGPDVGTQLYETTNYFYDLAVLSLSTPATVGTPIQLAGADERKTWGGGIAGLLSGWGALEPGDRRMRLRRPLLGASAPSPPTSACAQNHGEHFSLASQLCAGPPEGGYGVCRGDSGGPLAVPVEVGATLGVRLAGLASLGGNEMCSQTGFIDQYVRVSDAPIRDAIVRGIQPYVIDAARRLWGAALRAAADKAQKAPEAP